MMTKTTTKPSFIMYFLRGVRTPDDVVNRQATTQIITQTAMQNTRQIAKPIQVIHTMPNSQTPTRNLYRKHKNKVLIFLLLMLVVMPTVPAQASIFDPILRVLLPFYQKITGIFPSDKSTNDKPANSKDGVISTQTTQNATTQDTNNKPNLANTVVVKPVPARTDYPDLFALLQAEFAAGRDDPTTALALYKEQSFKDNATAVFERALSLSMQLERPEQSLVFAKAWQARNPDHIPAWFYVVHLAVKAEDYATITQNLAMILDYDPKADLNQIFAEILPQSLDAKRRLLHALQSLNYQDNPSLSVLKAGLLMHLDEPKVALLHLEEALKIQPDNLAYLTLKADALKYLGDNTALQQFLTAAIAKSTGDNQKQLYLYQARTLIDMGDLKQAWTILQAAHRHFSNDSELTLLASLVALDIQAYVEARQLLQGLSLHPNMKSEANYYLALSYERTQDFATALTHFRLVDDVQFILPATQKQVAYELLSDNPAAAIAALLRLRERYEIYASESYTLQADILLRQGKKSEAADLLNNAYRQYPDDTRLLYAYTRLLDDTNDRSQKQAHLQTLLEQEPDNLTYQLEQARMALLVSPEDKLSLDRIMQISQIAHTDPRYDRQLQLDALIILAENALTRQDYQAVLDYLQPTYSLAPTLKAGVLLLRAYQGLGDMQAVNELLDELKTRFDNTATDITPVASSSVPSLSPSP